MGSAYRLAPEEGRRTGAGNIEFSFIIVVHKVLREKSVCVTQCIYLCENRLLKREIRNNF
jgi:hypothetical protein